MNRVSGWWVGATVVPTWSELWSLAVAAGGWDALEGCGHRELVALGVEVNAARQWVESPDGETVGVPITRADPRYPVALQLEERAPPVLYVQGCLERLGQRPAMAVVGTRRCSGRGSAIARHLGRELAQRGVVVISGLARGIDAAAHQGALAAGGGQTVAVLGHGLGHQSPVCNGRLRDQIASDGGLVVAGWPDRVPADKWTFPLRNRWVAGLAQGTVFVEGPVRSGAGITARDTIEQGSDVWVVPGPPDEPVVAGPLELMARQIAEDREQIEILQLRLTQAVELLDQGTGVSMLRRSSLASALYPPEKGRVRLLTGVREFVEAVVGPPDPVPQQTAWMDHLLSGATVEQVAREWGCSQMELQGDLTRRELKGELVRLAGGRYARAT